MDTRLLESYNRELAYLRELGGEFAEEFPKVAGRLGLSAFECADPYVERLLEGFAFLAARVQLKIDAEFPRFTEHLLERVCPNYLGPTPSMAVVQLHPDPRQAVLSGGFRVPRGTAVRSVPRRGEATACEYRTAHDVTLFPVEVTSLALTPDAGDLGPLYRACGRPAKAALRVRLRTTNGAPFSALSMNRLTLFIRGGDHASLRLLELLVCRSVGVAVREPGSRALTVDDGAGVRAVGFDEGEALLPSGPRAFQGYRLLHEYFAFPGGFRFVELTGLGAGVRGCGGPEIEIVVALDSYDAALESSVAASQVAPFCTPVINLFPKSADRIQLTDRDHEYRIVPDRTRPLDFEVHSVLDVTGFGVSGKVQRRFAPFYASHQSADASPGAFFTVQRRPRLVSSRQRTEGTRSDYLGGETSVSLVDDLEGPYASDLTQIAVDTLCTNRDLPLSIPIGEGVTDLVVESGPPVASVRFVAGPSAPRASPASGEHAWRLISHLSLNYLSLTDPTDGGGAGALREMLELYADRSDPATMRLIEGVRSVATRPVVRRLPIEGPASVARGVEITVDCDETAFEGTSAVILGLVLDRFLAKYVSINSFTETVLRSVQRGEILRWPLRMGRRPSL